MICEELQAVCGDLLTRVVRGTGSASLKVTGFSMLPAIWPGDVLTVKSIPFELLEVGQILLYRRNGKLVAHRIIQSPQQADDCVVTRGDSVPTLDPPISASDVIGQVVAIRRHGRSVSFRSSAWQRATAWVLRRSDAATRLLMRWSTLDRRWLRPDPYKLPSS